MISEEKNKPHEKHVKINRPDLGTFGRNEIALIGTTCANIRSMAYAVCKQLNGYKIAYVDADHTSARTAANHENVGSEGLSLEYTDKITLQRFDFNGSIGTFQRRSLFNEQDLIIVNGNHFSASAQIVIIDPVKDLSKKPDQLTNVQLVILKDKDAVIPHFLEQLPGFQSPPVLSFGDEKQVADFVSNFIQKRVPPLKGLVLSGGHSTRMKKDKGTLQYHGISQREYLFELLGKYCQNTFVSCNAQQAADNVSFPLIQDSFLELGPLGGILSALKTDPNAAWLTVACDLPYLSENTIDFLVRQRNPSKIATAFLEPNGEFPEPLVTIWEPKGYPVLLQLLGQGYSCPRKALINSDVELLKAPVEKEFLNANFPEEFELAYHDLQAQKKK